MKFRYCILILLLALGLNTFMGCEKQTRYDQKIVAAIESDYKISFTDLNKYVHDEFYHRRFRDKNEAYTRALNEMILNRLRCIDFFETGLHNDQQLIQNIRRLINEELIVKYFESEYLSKYTNEEFAQNIYNQMGKEVYYQQIVINKPKNASETQLEALEKQALEIKAKADKGADFDELLNQYSEIGLENTDHSTSMIDWRSSFASPHNRVIFNLNEGEIRILDEYHAYYIINIIDVKKINLEPFEKIKKELISKLRETYYYTSLNEYDRDKNNLFDPNSLNWNEKTLDQLIEWAQIPEFYPDIYKDTLQAAIADGRNMTILTYSEGQIDLKEYLRLLNEILILSNSRDLDKKTLQDFIVEAMRSDIIIRKAQDLGFEKKVFHPRTKNTILQYKIIDLYDQVMIESKIPEPTNAALREFYQANKDSLYYQLEKINLFAMVYPDKSEAEKTWAKIQAGTSFEEAGNRWFVKTFIKDRDGQIKSYLSKEPPYLGQAAFKLQESEVDGIIEYTDPEKGPQYAVIKCAKRTPEKQLSYADVQKSIADDFTKYHRDRISREVNQNLRNKYRIKVYDNVLTEALAVAGKDDKSSPVAKGAQK